MKDLREELKRERAKAREKVSQYKSDVIRFEKRRKTDLVAIKRLQRQIAKVKK